MIRKTRGGAAAGGPTPEQIVAHCLVDAEKIINKGEFTLEDKYYAMELLTHGVETLPSCRHKGFVTDNYRSYNKALFSLFGEKVYADDGLNDIFRANLETLSTVAGYDDPVPGNYLIPGQITVWSKKDASDKIIGYYTQILKEITPPKKGVKRPRE